MRIQLSFVLGITFVLAACGTASTVPIEVQIQDGTLIPGVGWNQLQVVVKSLPGAELRVGDQTKSMEATRATEQFLVPKTGLRLGKNTIVASAKVGALFSKKETEKSAEWIGEPRAFLRFTGSSQGDAESILCPGVMCGVVLRATQAGHLPVEVESAIPATLTMAGSKVEVAPGRKTAIDIDLMPFIAVRTVETTQVSVPFSFEANGTKVDDALELGGASLTDLTARLFAQAEQGPILIPGEEAPKQPKRNLLLIVGAPTRKLIAVGKSGNYGDVDLVGVAKKTERSFACGPDSEILYNDLEVRVVDRRTAKTIGTKKVLADRVSCPPTAAGKVTGEVREDDMKHVLSEFLTK